MFQRNTFATLPTLETRGPGLQETGPQIGVLPIAAEMHGPGSVNGLAELGIAGGLALRDHCCCCEAIDWFRVVRTISAAGGRRK